MGINREASSKGVVLVTGASSGIGRSIAELMAVSGYTVYGTSRTAPFPEQQRQVSVSIGSKGTAGGEGVLNMINLNVRDEQSATKVVGYLLEKEGKIDILVNNAGFGIAGSVEDTTVEEAREQFETNFFGTQRMLRHVLPAMRKQGGGLIVNISSIAGVIPIPYQSMYCAAKSALESLSESLAMEVRRFGVKVVVVEPGDTKTNFTGKRQFTAAARKDSAYGAAFEKSIAKMEKDEQNGDDPMIYAKAVLRVAGMKSPPFRVVAGLQYKVFVLLKRLLPVKLVQDIVGSMY